MMKLINTPQKLKIERREWYERLQYDISPLFQPAPYDAQIAHRLTALDDSPLAVQLFASVAERLSDYAYWFFLGVCWVQYTGWSKLELWKELFSSNRPHRKSCLMKPTELRLFKKLPKVVHCYRVHRPGETDWISYTLDFDTALKFAAIRGVSTIHEYRIPRKRLCCLFLRRHEYEVLCINKKDAILHKVIEKEPLHA